MEKINLSKKTLALIISGILLLMLVVCLATGGIVYYFVNSTNQAEIKKLKDEKETLTNVSVTPTADEEEMDPNSTTNPTRTTTTPLSTPSMKIYNYDYLDISFSYPSNWSVSTTNSNVKGGGYKFECTSDYSDYLKNFSQCTNGTIEPKNLVISGPDGEKVTLWNISGIGGTQITLDNYKSFKMFNNQSIIYTYTNESNSNLFTTSIGGDLKTGSKSVWKGYIISIEAPKSSASTIETLLLSFKVNS